jgi:hypothetical protein
MLKSCICVMQNKAFIRCEIGMFCVVLGLCTVPYFPLYQSARANVERCHDIGAIIVTDPRDAEIK